MKLSQRREIVRRFKAGKSAGQLSFELDGFDFLSAISIIEQVIRDYMNGKFDLKLKARKK